MDKIKINTRVNAPVERAWEVFITPEYVMKWNHASDDWHSPKAENDLRIGGRFSSRMESVDGKEGFDFTGVYTEVIPNEKIAYTMDDGRKVEVKFEDLGDSTHVIIEFEPESENDPEFQKSGWQAILDNFKKVAEN